MDTVGSSISRGGSAGSTKSGADSVSPMVISAGPLSQTMSPAWISSTSSRSSPRVTHRCTLRAVSVPVTSQSPAAGSVSRPWPFQTVEVRSSSSPLRCVPSSTRPQPMRPR